MKKLLEKHFIKIFNFLIKRRIKRKNNYTSTSYVIYKNKYKNANEFSYSDLKECSNIKEKKELKRFM